MSFLLSYPQGTPNHFSKAQGSRGDVPGHHWSKIKSEVAPTERGERNSFSLPMSISPRQLRAGRTSQPVIPLRGLGFPSCAEHCQRPVSVTEEKEGESSTQENQRMGLWQELSPPALPLGDVPLTPGAQALCSSQPPSPGPLCSASS